MPQIPPAEGERRAISGYYGQYLVSASLILRGLGEGSLEWIRVADPDAERVDDFQLGSAGRIDAYQMKWHQYGGLFTFNELVSGRDQESKLIAQLASGWSRFKGKYPSSRVVVHLITNQMPSTSTRAILPIDDICRPTPNHFAAFIEQVWKPLQRTPQDEPFDIPREWLSVWEALRDASGLEGDEFQTFARNCALEFGYQASASSTRQMTRDEQYAEEDLKHIIGVLFQSVADTERIIELSYEQLIRRLGWADRLEFRNRHRFPIDEGLYQPIEFTVQELKRAIDELSGGYIAVLGSPGSGKSTLLTKTLTNLGENFVRLVRYYAYVPDTQYPTNIRGESVNFLHDVGLQIDRSGITIGHNPARSDRNQLLLRFHEQLERLGKDWKENGRKTIILIDGLDHIKREQNPSNSLLEDLPFPNQIPEGVYFVLGTQTDAHLPARVQDAVRNAAHKIEMRSLERHQVLDILGRCEPVELLTTEQREAIFHLSGGHPLYLSYLINRVKLSKDSAQLQSELQAAVPYEGDIRASYHSYWMQFDGDEKLRRLLGLLARVRGAIDLNWVKKWEDPMVVDRLGTRFAHYFRIETSTRWYFFHNSFQLFIEEKTAEFPPGEVDYARNAEFHIQLANIYAREPEGSHLGWEEIYHRGLGGEHSKVLELATQEYFRGQFLALRPVDAINTDILVALRSAGETKGPVAMARLCLAGAEMSQREFYLDMRSLLPTILRLNSPQTVIRHLRDGNQLLVEPEIALEAAIQLMRQGFGKEARKLFELSEPLGLLEGSPRIFSGRAENLLQCWARAATLFQPINELVSTIRRIQVAADKGDEDFGIDSGESTHYLQSQLLLSVALQLLEEQRWIDLQWLSNTFNLTRRYDVAAHFRLHSHVCRERFAEGDSEGAKEHLQVMLDTGRKYLSAEEQTLLGESVYRVMEDSGRATVFIQGINQPQLQTGLISSEGDLAPFGQRFRLNRLLYALGDQRSPSDIIPKPESLYEEGVALFERALCSVAHIWARAWVGNLMDASITKIEVLPLLRLFNRSYSDTAEWVSWYPITQAKGEFYSLLVSAIAQHGKEALEELRDAFEQEWKDSRSRRYWPRSVRRCVVLSFLKEGVSKDWVVEHLRNIGELIVHDGDVFEHVQEHLNQAEAWLEAEQGDYAKASLRKALEVSFGVGYRKDYQVNLWIEWLGKVCEIEPEKASERITRFVQALESLEHSTEGPAADSAADHLLGVACRWSPVRAVQLFLWLSERGMIRYRNGMLILLEGTLKTPNPPLEVAADVFKEFLLPFDTVGESEVLALLLKRLAESGNTDRFFKRVSCLVLNVRQNAAPSARVAWNRGLLQGLQGTELTAQDFGLQDDLPDPDEQDDSIWTNLVLADTSTTLNSQEVDDRVASLGDLQQLMEMEGEGSFFNWTPVVQKLIESTNDVATLCALAALFKDDERRTRILVLISSRLSTLGKRNEAWDIGMQALNASSSYGWNGIYDGASRIQAFRALSSTDRERVVPLIYDVLVNDLEDNFGLVTDAALALADILELASPNLPLIDLWSEVEEHTANLLRTNLSPATPEIFREPTKDSSHRALIELAASQVTHSCLPIAQKAQRFLGKRLLARDSETSNVLNNLLGQSEAYQERILVVIEAASFVDAESVKKLREQVENLSRSPNWSIRLTAKSIARNCNWAQSRIDKYARPLPAIYSITLPPLGLEIPDGSNPVSHGRLVPDSEEPERIVEPFDVHLKTVSKLAEIDTANVYRRVVDIMHELAPFEDTWSEQAEGRLQSTLRSSGLIMPFVRPRARFARRAVFHAVAELDDAGKLSKENRDGLETFLRVYDAKMVLEKPSERPVQVSNMVSGEQNWVERAHESLVLTDWSSTDARFVLAERTILKRYGLRGELTEKRFSVVESSLLSIHVPVTEPREFFTSTVNGSVSEYATLAHTSETPWLAVRNSPYAYESPGSDWLAINPAVAKDLGWNFVADGLFRWTDSNGRTMAESVWWTDGTIGLSTNREEINEVGEGWVVLISKTALRALCREFLSLSRVSLVMRRIDNEGKITENLANSRKPI